MLEIIIIEEVEEGKSFVSLDLYPETRIDIVWENPFFLFDEISAMFSLSFNLPTTPVNLLAFNYPDRIPIKDTSQNYSAIIKHSGLQIAQGEIIFFKYDNDLQTQFVGSVEISKKPLSEINFGTKDFNVGLYGISSFGTSPNELNYSDAKWDDYKNEALARSEHEEDFQYCIAPVRKKDVEWSGDEAIFGLKNSLFQYINFFNAKFKNFHVGNPDHSHTPVIPFPAVHKIIDDIFGDGLQNNLFKENDLANLVFVSPGHPNYNEDLYQTSNVLVGPPTFMMWYENLQLKEFLIPVSEHTVFENLGVSGVNLAWYFSRFMPNYKCNETLKDLLKTFSITLFRVNRKWVMEFNNDIFDRDIIQIWNDKIDGKPEIIRELPKNYAFSFDGESSTFQEKVIEFETWADVFQDAMDAQPDIEYFYKTNGNPQILSIEKTTNGAGGQALLNAKIARTGLDASFNQDHEDTLSITSKVKPLNMSIEHYWWNNHKWDPMALNPLGIEYGDLGNALEKGHWHVPVIDKLNKDSAPHIMLFAGRKPTLSAAEGVAAPLQPPGFLLAQIDGNNIDVSFIDQNNFADHNNYSRGYTIEYRTDSEIHGSDYWFVHQQLYPGIDWNPPQTIYATIPNSSFNGNVVQIRVWAFSGAHASSMALIEPNGLPEYEEATSNNDDEYPYLTNHHTDHRGEKIFDFSLIPDAPDSFIEVFHNKMKQWCENEKLRVNARFKLSAVDLMQIDMRDKILLHGRKFWIEKMQFSLTVSHIEPADVNLISCPISETS